jgi:hypothetical protein
MPSTNKLGLSVLLLAGFALGYVLGRFSQPNQVDSPASSQAGSETDLAALRSENTRMRDQLSALRATRDFDDAAPERSDATNPPPPERGRRFGGRGISLADLPPQHKLTLTRQRYGQLLHELSLSDAEADAVLSVLSTYEPAGPPGMRRRQLREPTPEDQERERLEKEELTKLLGADRAAELERLRASMPLRNELSSTRSQLERIGEPMTDEQQKQLMQKLSARALAPYPGGEENATAEERAERFQAWRRDRSRSVRESAEGVLTPKQIQRLEESDSLSEAMRPRPGGGGAAGSAAPPR